MQPDTNFPASPHPTSHRILFTVSVAVHGQLETTRRCCESIIAASKSVAGRYEVIVVDNGSPGGVVEYVESLEARPGIPAFSVRRFDENRGFGAAHNEALRYARGAYFVVLNNDCQVPPGWLVRFREAFLADPQLAVAGVLGTSSALTAEGVGGGIGNEYVEGSCLCTLTHLARKHGLFDPLFRLAYCEDADFSLRMRKLGYRITHLPLDLPHSGGVTAAALRESGTDLDGCHAYNHEVLRTRWADYLGTRQFSQKLTVRRTGAIGDVLMLTPALRAIKRGNHAASIVLQTACPEAVAGNPDIDAVESAPAAPLGVKLDLAYESRPFEHPSRVFADMLGVPGASLRPIFHPAARDRERAREWKRSERCVICPRIEQEASWPGRSPNQAVLASVSRTLQERGSWDVRWLEPGCCTSLSELGAIIERAHLYVGVDSAPMHLARAAMVPVVGIFGAISPALRLTPGCGFETGVTAPSVGCLGCHHAYPPPRTTGKCLRPRPYCMERITAEDILQAIERVLEAKRMQLETSKVRSQILHYFAGSNGIDVGCQRDPLRPDCVCFDKDDWPEVTHRGDARKLPFENHAFDWLWSSHCLEDLADTEGALAEWVRVVRPGGIVGLYVPHPKLYTGYNADHLHPGFTPEELTSLLTACGCLIIECRTDDGPGRYSTLAIARKMSAGGAQDERA